jgi:hypothetical protein
MFLPGSLPECMQAMLSLGKVNDGDTAGLLNAETLTMTAVTIVVLATYHHGRSASSAHTHLTHLRCEVRTLHTA